MTMSLETQNPEPHGQIALFIYGLPGAGKSTVLSVAEDYDIPSITMGDVVRVEAEKALGEGFDSSELGEWATRQREMHGPTIMAEYTLEHVVGVTEPLVIIEGPRSPAELDVFADTFTTRTLRIDAPFDARLHRLQERGRDGEETFTAADLHDRDSRELIGWALGELFAADSPDYTIENTSSLTAYEDRITEILTQLTNLG